MNYRHAYHAGNFADVVKHAALVALLLHLRRKDKPFAIIDTHAGRGLYDLSAAEALKTGEATEGIARLLDLPPEETPLGTYLDLVRGAGADRYPGSPWLAARLLRPQDRLIAIEKHPEDFAALRAMLAPFARAKAEQADGYARLPALLPPPERRGLVLIDPPFEAEDEFERAAQTFAKAHARFATGQYLLWYPVKSRAGADAFANEVLAAGPRTALRLEIARSPAPGDTRLAAAGLVVVNPPFGFAEQMTDMAPKLERALAARLACEWLREEA